MLVNDFIVLSNHWLDLHRDIADKKQKDYIYVHIQNN